MARIHPTALVDPAAQIDASAQIGAFCIIGPNVRIGPHTEVHPYAQVVGHTQIGRNNTIHSHCVIGGPPQDKKYAQEPSRLEIGDGNTFRECCTINIGTQQGGGLTRIGDDNWVMAYVHIAHDCQVGSHVILANATQLAGHVCVDDWAILGGLTGVHQFVKIGAHAMTGAATYLSQDLPPYVIASGNPAQAHGVNTEGLRRRGFDADQIQVIRRAYKLVYKSGLGLEQAMQMLGDRQSVGASTREQSELVDRFAGFLSSSDRGIVR